MKKNRFIIAFALLFTCLCVNAQIPRGAVAEKSAPGGYYFPLLCGIDVAGADVEVDQTKNWSDVCDPQDLLPVKPRVNEMAPVNPCPKGWALPTEKQLRAIADSLNWVVNPTAPRNPGEDYFYWKMRDGERSNGDIFGAAYGKIEVWVLSGEARGRNENSVWRLVVNRSSSPRVGVSSNTRTRPFVFTNEKGRKFYSTLRCVRSIAE